ncbi:MAG TPA: DUF3006 domain-containing protein [Firmicutes bacterium]|nr:DUF3006 domain-containing protein [Bacillota bacterium]
MFYSLEHFEGELAVLEDDDENRWNIPRSLLPADAKTGDVFTREGESFFPAPEETRRRREAVLRLQAKLRKK